jgi:hypothetical protein
MNREPRLSKTLVVAGGLALGAAAFLLALVGEPTWPARIAAIGIIVVIVAFAIVWHWGFTNGMRWGGKGDP